MQLTTIIFSFCFGQRWGLREFWWKVVRLYKLQRFRPILVAILPRQRHQEIIQIRFYYFVIKTLHYKDSDSVLFLNRRNIRWRVLLAPEYNYKNWTLLNYIIIIIKRSDVTIYSNINENISSFTWFVWPEINIKWINFRTYDITLHPCRLLKAECKGQPIYPGKCRKEGKGTRIVISVGFALYVLNLYMNNREIF